MCVCRGMGRFWHDTPSGWILKMRFVLRLITIALALTTTTSTEPSLLGVALGSNLSDIEQVLGKSRLTQRMPDGAYRISGCREYRTWSLSKGNLEICMDNEHRAISMTFLASSPLAAYGDVVLLTDTFGTATSKTPTSATKNRTNGEGMLVQSLSFQLPGKIKVNFEGSVREETRAGVGERWDDSMIIRSVTIAYISRFPFEKPKQQNQTQFLMPYLRQRTRLRIRPRQLWG
jgi:hypothetical protein